MSAVLSRLPSANPAETVAQLVEEIGEPAFSTKLIAYLHSLCGADHFSAFRLGPACLDRVIAGSLEASESASRALKRYYDEQWWRKDPVMVAAQAAKPMRACQLVRVDMANSRYVELRSEVYTIIGDRLLLTGRRHGFVLGMSVLRTRENGVFGPQAMQRLQREGDVLLSLVGKHNDCLSGRADLVRSLTMLEDIETCLIESGELPRREVQVCARILHGMSTIGIALDLDIGEESVKTYRKRAYSRLGIATERELLTWYLGMWSRSHDDIRKCTGVKPLLSRAAGSGGRRLSTIVLPAAMSRRSLQPSAAA